MKEGQRFIAELATIAETGTIASALERAHAAFQRFITQARTDYSGDRHADARVRIRVSDLEIALALEINRAHAGQFGALIDQIHVVVRDWLRKNQFP
jgi:hypothetical protein